MTGPRPAVPLLDLAAQHAPIRDEVRAAIDRVVDAHPDVEVGSYPTFGEARYRTKLTFDGLDEEKVKSARDAFSALLPAGAIVSGD